MRYERCGSEMARSKVLYSNLEQEIFCPLPEYIICQNYIERED